MLRNSDARQDGQGPLAPRSRERHRKIMGSGADDRRSVAGDWRPSKAKGRRKAALSSSHPALLLFLVLLLVLLLFLAGIGRLHRILSGLGRLARVGRRSRRGRWCRRGSGRGCRCGRLILATGGER